MQFELNKFLIKIYYVTLQCDDVSSNQLVKKIKLFKLNFCHQQINFYITNLFHKFNSRQSSSIIKSGSIVQIPIDVTCSKINYLEHIQVLATIETQERGRLELALQSPSGTK